MMHFVDRVVVARGQESSTRPEEAGRANPCTVNRLGAGGVKCAAPAHSPLDPLL